MAWYDDFDAWIAENLCKTGTLREEPMREHTTFRVGGPARRFARPADWGALAALLTQAETAHWPYCILGNGSNVLVPDEGLDALVIHTGCLNRIERQGDVLWAEAGISLARLATYAAQVGLAGLAFAHGIPGSLGGGVCMNAGAYGGEMRQVITTVTAWFPDTGVTRLTAEALLFGYRQSLFSHRRGAVLHAEIHLRPGDSAEISNQMADLDRRRREKQPLDLPSAGSAFKRPPGYFAGSLIQQCGLKGARVGGAQVSEKHAGFIVNTGGATCADILALIARVQETVWAQAGVRLMPELRILKPWGAQEQ